MAINFDNALGVHANALRLRSERAEILATNLVNADTPNFKARDINFSEVLSDISNQSSPNNLNTSNQLHISTDPFSHDMSGDLKYRTVIQDSLDGNTVDEEIEQAQFMQNSVNYQASLQFLGGKFTTMLKALKGE